MATHVRGPVTPAAAPAQSEPAARAEAATEAERSAAPEAPTEPGATPAPGSEFPTGTDLGGGVLVEGLTRAFGERTVLDGIDLTIRPTEFVALLGRSGSGKSTLLRNLARLDTGHTGTVTVPERRAVAFQDSRLLPWARVLDNVILGLDGSDARERGTEALAEVGLADHARAWPATLSGGEGQRAALARALVREPELLLLDEPFGALDALTRLRMHTLLRRLHRRHAPATLLVTHDVEEAVLLADRVLVLTEGSISLDLPVRLPETAPRRSPEFADLRDRLLAELGVDEDQR